MRVRDLADQVLIHQEVISLWTLGYFLLFVLLPLALGAAFSGSLLPLAVGAACSGSLLPRSFRFEDFYFQSVLRWGC